MSISVIPGVVGWGEMSVVVPGIPSAVEYWIPAPTCDSSELNPVTAAFALPPG